ncbi:MAG: acetate/propionate family kinase [bacterium]|nr:acetate/propionate family kinase [bacterium]
MIILTVNAGSSSIRLAAFVKKGSGMEKPAAGKYKPEEDSPSILKAFLQEHKIKDVSIIAHRVVHGGTQFVNSCLIDSAVEREIDRLSPLVPLHNPFALKWIRTCRAAFGDQVPQAAVFDTAFYSTLPDVATIYALPGNLCQQYHIRRYGFHGIAHRAMWRRWSKLRPDLKDGGRVISLQLGAGCSISAVHNGKAVDTSMGFSPLEGLVMATRSGDIDPGVILYLQRSCGLSIDRIEEMLNHSSGLLGVSGISGDMRALMESGLPGARLAVDLFCYRARKYIGAYLAVLGGADAILFGGGVGENAPAVRRLILKNMHWIGITLDFQANSAIIGKEGRVSSPESKIDVWVIPVDEASVLAREAIGVMNKT